MSIPPGGNAVPSLARNLEADSNPILLKLYNARVEIIDRLSLSLVSNVGVLRII
jgi:hypothetical protein